MRIKELHLKDWRVVRQADFQGLSDFVVIAGPNGVGKTIILISNRQIKVLKR